jgi:hypothetical protein
MHQYVVCHAAMEALPVVEKAHNLSDQQWTTRPAPGEKLGPSDHVLCEPKGIGGRCLGPPPADKSLTNPWRIAYFAAVRGQMSVIL